DYVLRNEGVTDGTFSMRQVLDTFLWGNENPIYTLNGQVVQKESTFIGAAVPAELIYQSGIHNPAFRGFLDLRLVGRTAPSRVTIGLLNNLTSTFGAGGGATISGSDGAGLDTGVSIAWDNVHLTAGDSQTMSFIIGFLPSGPIYDT